MPGARLVAVHWRPAGVRAAAGRRAGARDPARAAVARAGQLRRDRRLPARRAGAAMSDEFELLVIGGGPAGLSAARGYRGAGGARRRRDRHRRAPNALQPPAADQGAAPRGVERGRASDRGGSLVAGARRRPGQRPRGRCSIPDVARCLCPAVASSATEAACSRPGPSRPGCRYRVPTTQR